MWRAHLRRGPFKDETSGETAAKSVEEPERVAFRRHQRRVDVQAVTHGIVAPCMNTVGEDTLTARQEDLTTDRQNQKTTRGQLLGWTFNIQSTAHLDCDSLQEPLVNFN